VHSLILLYAALKEYCERTGKSIFFG
jgi:hypothetical protein